jgi:hypothetical protein
VVNGLSVRRSKVQGFKVSSGSESPFWKHIYERNVGFVIPNLKAGTSLAITLNVEP